MVVALCEVVAALLLAFFVVLQLVIASGFIAKLLGNAHIARYLAQHHGELLPELRAIVSASSLDQAPRHESA